MPRDWIAWHRRYDEPGSSLARRLDVVRDYVRAALRTLDGRPLRLISMCAGDGRDVLPVLAEEPRHRAVRAVLVEIDRELADRAGATAARLRLPGVQVRVADAGRTDAYTGFAPADVTLACGVFGNIPPDDVRRTIRALTGLTVRGGAVIWTRGRTGEGDPAGDIRRWFAEAGFAERAFAAPADASFRVGMHVLARAGGTPYREGARMFGFR